MAGGGAQPAWLCLGFGLLLCVTAQTVIPASDSSQSAMTPSPSFVAPGVSDPTICAQGDLSCNAALVQPDNDTDYINCINSPAAPDCTSPDSGAAIESAASPEEACPTDSILDQGISEQTLETQVRARQFVVEGSVSRCAHLQAFKPSLL